jgi:lysophospholipase L1-like esterase
MHRALVAICVFAGLLGMHRASWARGADSVQTVLCIGDSITAADRSWARFVGEHAAIDTINAGLGGRQTGAAAETFQKAVDAGQEFDRVIFFLGVNNLPGRDPRPPEQKLANCVQDMGRAIDLAVQKVNPGNVIVVAPCSVNPQVMREPSETDARMTSRRERNVKKGYDICQPMLEQLEADYRALAAAKGVRFVSLLKVVSPDNLPDGLHPNEAGQRQMSAVIEPFLLETWKPNKLAPVGR